MELAIAKTCVEGLGGRIWASNREGEGGLVVKLEMDAELKCSEGLPNPHCRQVAARVEL